MDDKLRGYPSDHTSDARPEWYANGVPDVSQYFTPIPNMLLDVVMRRRKPAEWMVLCCIARKTIGWRKTSDSIAISQIESMTGLGRRTVFDAIRALVAVNLIIVVRRQSDTGGDAPSLYAMNTSSDYYREPVSGEGADFAPYRDDIARGEGADFAPTKERHTVSEDTVCLSKEIDTDTECVSSPVAPTDVHSLMLISHPPVLMPKANKNHSEMTSEQSGQQRVTGRKRQPLQPTLSHAFDLEKKSSYTRPDQQPTLSTPSETRSQQQSYQPSRPNMGATRQACNASKQPLTGSTATKQPKVSQHTTPPSREARIDAIGKSSRLSDDWALDARGYADAERIGLDRETASHESEQFADYHRAKGSRMMDWQAAWRTWCRNHVKYAKSNGAGSQKPNGARRDKYSAAGEDHLRSSLDQSRSTVFDLNDPDDEGHTEDGWGNRL